MNDKPNFDNDSPKTFDITRPNKTTPSPTSRPLITGDQPLQADPMVKSESENTAPEATPEVQPAADPTPVQPQATPTEAEAQTADPSQNDKLASESPLSATDSNQIVVAHHKGKPHSKLIMFAAVALVVIVIAVVLALTL